VIKALSYEKGRDQARCARGFSGSMKEDDTFQFRIVVLDLHLNAGQGFFDEIDQFLILLRPL
jgi:hypothetical protein